MEFVLNSFIELWWQPTELHHSRECRGPLPVAPFQCTDTIRSELVQGACIGAGCKVENTGQSVCTCVGSDSHLLFVFLCQTVRGGVQGDYAGCKAGWGQTGFVFACVSAHELFGCSITTAKHQLSGGCCDLMSVAFLPTLGHNDMTLPGRCCCCLLVFSHAAFI